MGAVTELNSTPDVFRAVVQALETARFRPEIALRRIVPPHGLAPHAISFAAEVVRGPHRRNTAPDRPRTADDAPAAGRFVVLYDESCPQPWEGPFRIVSWFRSRTDTAMGRDDLLTDVETLTHALHRFPGDSGAIAMAAIDEDFFVVALGLELDLAVRT